MHFKKRPKKRSSKKTSGLELEMTLLDFMICHRIQVYRLLEQICDLTSTTICCRNLFQSSFNFGNFGVAFCLKNRI